MADKALADGYIKNIEDVLKPRGHDARVAAASGVDKVIDAASIIRNELISKTISFKAIQELINTHFTATSPKPAADFSLHFNGISKDFGVLCEKEGYYDDKLYWNLSGPPGNAAKPKMETFFKNAFSGESIKCKVSVFNSKDVSISPGDANTEDIEMFLNYVPPIVANRLTPYLEVDFISSKSVTRSSLPGSSAADAPESFGYLNTPSTLRFLLGSVDSQKFSGADKVMHDSLGQTIRNSTRGEDKIEKSVFKQERSVGMELFFAPQSLTNMQGLTAGEHTSRLMDVKPFLPLASITNFEISMANAGSGDMVTKKGKLELKIHDKTRISEFSEFLRGGTNFSSGRIWTSFGWLSGLGVSADEDPWSNFINTKMHSEHCWMVGNAAFGFDQAGQVTLTLDIYTASVANAKSASIKAKDGSYEAFLLQFQRILDEIGDEASNLTSILGPDVRLVQYLNTAASGKMLSNVKPQDIEQTLRESIAAYEHNGVIDPVRGKALLDKLTSVLKPGKDVNAGASGINRNSMDSQRTKTITSILVDSLSNSLDPFLPNLVNKDAYTSQRYFNAKYIRDLEYGNKPPKTEDSYIPLDTPASGSVATDDAGDGDDAPKKKVSGAKNNEKPEEIKFTKIDLPNLPKFVSFGKIYVANIIPAFIEANPDLKADPNAEIQVFFYSLNDHCGPVSSQSIAEFACDIQRFSYQIDDQLKSSNKHDLTIDEFSKLLIRSQFGDMRSVGYGKLARGLYKAFDPVKPAAEIWKGRQNYESHLAAWQAENPSFAPPIIETYIEYMKGSDDENFSSSNIHSRVAEKKNGTIAKKSIVRFHIYDRQANSKLMFRKFVEFSGQPEIGDLDEGEFRQRIKINSKDNISKAQIQEFLNEYEKADTAKTKVSRERELEIGKKLGITFNSPGGVNTPLKVNRKLFGKGGIRESLRMLAPTLQIGSNGSLITGVTVASKADDLAAAGFLTRQRLNGGSESNNSLGSGLVGLEQEGGMPIKTHPATLSITCLGTPIAKPYQSYFIDLGTGTTLDNLYTCTNVSHQFQQGKFTTNMTFMYTDGYGKFVAPPTIRKILTAGSRSIDKAAKDLNDKADAAAKAAAAQKKGGGGGPGGGGGTTAPNFGGRSSTAVIDQKSGASQIVVKKGTGGAELDPTLRENLNLAENASAADVADTVAAYNRESIRLQLAQNEVSAKKADLDQRKAAAELADRKAYSEGAPGRKDRARFGATTADDTRAEARQAARDQRTLASIATAEKSGVAVKPVRFNLPNRPVLVAEPADSSTGEVTFGPLTPK